MIRLLAVHEADEAGLMEVAADARVEVVRTGEPRWDRVGYRARQGSARARELIQLFGEQPRPWGVLGSVWPEDLEIWRGRFVKGAGTLWVVPHRVDRESVEAIEGTLLRAGLRVTRSTGMRAKAAAVAALDCILVDEMGTLLELYASADWAYIGGGFGVSMHSTIEPAIFGIPVACGSEGAEKFPEIGELVGTGQLTLVKDGEGLDAWLCAQGARHRDVVARDRERQQWLAQADARMGATGRVLDVLEKCANLNAEPRGK